MLLKELRALGVLLGGRIEGAIATREPLTQLGWAVVLHALRTTHGVEVVECEGILQELHEVTAPRQHILSSGRARPNGTGQPRQIWFSPYEVQRYEKKSVCDNCDKDNVFFFSFLAGSVRDDNNDIFKYVIIYLYYYLYYLPLLSTLCAEKACPNCHNRHRAETFKIYNLTFRIYKLLGDGGKKRLQRC